LKSSLHPECPPLHTRARHEGHSPRCGQPDLRNVAVFTTRCP